MTDRKLLEDVRDALKPFEIAASVINSEVLDSTAIGIVADGATLFGPNWPCLGDFRTAATTLARVEAALGETAKPDAIAEARRMALDEAAEAVKAEYDGLQQPELLNAIRAILALKKGQ